MKRRLWILPGALRRSAALALILALHPAYRSFVPSSGTALAAQSVTVTVTDESDGRPVHGALAVLTSAEGRDLARSLTDQRGRTAFASTAPGRYSVRIEMIGRATHVSEPFQVTSEAGHSLNVALRSVAIELDGVEIEAQRGPCSIRAEEAEGLAAIWDEARKALAATSFTASEAVYRYLVEAFEFETDPEGRLQGRETRGRTQTFANTPYRSRPAADLIELGFMQREGDEYAYFAPDADVLLSDDFLDTHCLRSESPRQGREGLVGVGFRPVSSSRVTDIAGVLWIDRESFELVLLEFRYENFPWEVSGMNAGGEVHFRRLPGGTWIVPEWSLRKPILATGFDARGSRLTRLLGYDVNGATVLEVQEAGGATILEAELGSIEGMALGPDGEPMEGARIGLWGSSQSIFSDAQGRFAFRGLTPGSYRIRFDHEVLREIGYAPEAAIVALETGAVASTLLRVPSLGEVAAESCSAGEKLLAADAGTLFGRVFEGAPRRPAPRARVRIEWELAQVVGVGTDDARITGVRREGVTLETDANGRFLACGVPVDHLFAVTITSGESSIEEDVRITRGESVLVRTFQLEIR